MNALSVAQMREADRRCIEELGIPGAVLMNSAGVAVFREVPYGPVGIVCGKGNNGGDGFVVARLCLLAGYDTRVVLVGNPDGVRGDAATFLNVYRRLGGEVVWSEDEGEIREHVESMMERVFLVDALLGTGFQGEPRGAVKAAIESWPDVSTVAVDVPSGLDADTGKASGPCVRASVTVTFQFMKRGFLAPEAQEYLGRVVVADIGIPAVCGDDEAWGKRGESD